MSTASAGRFDKKLAGEPSTTAGKRKQYESGVGATAAERDATKMRKVVDKMFPESGDRHAKVVNRSQK